MEGEVFLLGIWKNFDELEESMSMPELIAALEASRDRLNRDRHFFAALQGIDLDNNKDKGRDMLAEMRTIVMTGGKASDPNDVMSLVGRNAVANGFGIGQGLNYSEGDSTEWWK